MLRETMAIFLMLQSGTNTEQPVNSEQSTNHEHPSLVLLPSTEHPKSFTVHENLNLTELLDQEDEDNSVDVEMIVVILVYGITFLLGSIGNTLVIIGIAKFKKMHSVTNIFLVSLASADLLLILTCIPFKVGKTLSYVWTLGEFICKFGHYTQNLSVICSVLTLTVISIERYHAILKPMQSRFTCTKSRAKKMVLAIWGVSVIFAIPILVGQVHKAVGPLKNFYWCKKEWPDSLYSQMYEVFMLLLVVILPLTVMMFAYSSICRELWNVLSVRGSMTAMSQLGSQIADRGKMEKVENSDEAGGGKTLVVMASENINKRKIKSCNQESNDDIRTKKQVIKMLVMIVVLFAVCWVPVTVENLLRAFDVVDDLSTGWRKHLRQTFDLLSYFNSCVNPVVYAFMSKNFRQSFLKAIRCHHFQKGRHGTIGHRSISYQSRCRPAASPYATRQQGRTQESTCLQGTFVETTMMNVAPSFVLNGR